MWHIRSFEQLDTVEHRVVLITEKRNRICPGQSNTGMSDWFRQATNHIDSKNDESHAACSITGNHRTTKRRGLSYAGKPETKRGVWVDFIVWASSAKQDSREGWYSKTTILPSHQPTLAFEDNYMCQGRYRGLTVADDRFTAQQTRMIVSKTMLARHRQLDGM